MAKCNSEQFRRFLSQIIASSSKNCILMTTGLVSGLPTVIIPYLTNDHDEVKLTFEEASWIASLKIIFMIAGAILSGLITSVLGHKRAMLISMAPHLLGMTLLYFSVSGTMVFIGMALMGLGVGLGETAISAYLGGICQPSIRGILLMLSSSMYQTGTLISFVLGSLFPWRTVVLLEIILPLIATMFIIISPEVPSWLLLKNRRNDAQLSLQWLRGWVPFETVQAEFHQIENHVRSVTKCESCGETDEQCKHPRKSFLGRIKEIFERKNIFAMSIVTTLCIFGNFRGRMAMKPFIVQILTAYGSPIDAKSGTVLVALVNLIGRLLAIVEIKILGKRKSSLISLFIIIIAFLTLGTYGAINFPYRWTSFQKENDLNVKSSYAPMVFFLIFFFFSGLAVDSLSSILLAEMIPLRNRPASTSFVLILSQISPFISTKSYIYLDSGWGLSGAMWFFSSVSIAEFIFILLCLPETEGVSIQHIEEFLSDKQRKFIDLNIKKYLEKKRNLLAIDCVVYDLPITAKRLRIRTSSMEAKPMQSC